MKRNPNGIRFLNANPNSKKTSHALKILNESDFFFSPEIANQTKDKLCVTQKSCNLCSAHSHL